MTAIAVASLAAPAAAQYYPNHNQNYPVQNQNYGNHNAHANMSSRIGQLQAQLQTGVRNGSINRREAGAIHQNIQRLIRTERQYSVNGITGREHAVLQQRIQTIRQQLRKADSGAQRQYGQWDRGAQSQYGQWDRGDQRGWGANQNGRVDANNDGWDDRDYNRNGRWDDDASYGYQQQQPAPRTGIAGIVESLLGGGGGLQVGQRVPSNLYGVPNQYRAQYRDGNGVYYRSDGRNIYQVDARSQTVVRIFRI